MSTDFYKQVFHNMTRPGVIHEIVTSQDGELSKEYSLWKGIVYVEDNHV